MNITTAVVALGALAQETRLQIFRMLVQAGESGMSVGDIAKQLGTKANGRLTFHLKELVSAELAQANQVGRYVFYSANYQSMNALLGYLTEHCCMGAPCGIDATPCSPSATPNTSAESR